MPDVRVGTLDNAQRFGCRSMAVYQNTTGFYYKVDGCREKVHGNQLWTTTNNVKMRGSTPINDVGGWEESNDWEDDEELAAAIAASLQDREDVRNVESPEEDTPPTNAGGEDGSSGLSSRDCSICLSSPSIMLMRPCNHVCACQTCARRLIRIPCPICRRLVTKVERVFF